MKKVIEMLKANGRVNDWKINLHRRESSELFFVKGELDCVRRTDTTNNRVTVYVDHDGFRGDSMFYMYPSTTDEEMEKNINDAVNRAMLIKNPPYSLAEAVEGSYELESNFSEWDSLALAKEVGKTALGAVEIEGTAINSLEVFITKHSEEIITSSGVHKSQTRYDAMVEAIPTYNGEKESVELYEQYNFASYEPEKLREEIAKKMAEVKARYEAVPSAGELSCPVVIGPTELRQLFYVLVDDLDYANVYSSSNLRSKGERVQPEGIGDPLDIRLCGSLPGSMRSSRFDIDGVELGTLSLIEKGVAAAYHGSNRFGQYIGEKPSGILPCMEVGCGSLSSGELDAAPWLELISMSGLQAELFSDYIGGEVRLAYLHEGEKITPLTGLSVSGKISEVLAGIRFSDKAVLSGGYFGPDKALLPGMKIF
ncbi:MAG: hypothetical protein IJY96_08490 [Oscillospiraceae bacterium]|nr:hypothetical protein [Oscillospiraceae bacterium]